MSNVTPTLPVTEQLHGNDAVLARFKAAYVNAEHGIVDAWLRPAGDDTFIEYQLSMDNADIGPEKLLERLGKIPNPFEELPTLITWFPRD